VSVRPTRRALLGGGAALAGGLLCGCDPQVPEGRQLASLWFTYGGKNRQVLEALVRRFNQAQDEFFVRAVYQGDYFEGLAKLRTAVAARAGPSFSHVVGEVVPYLAEAGVLEPLDGYSGARELDVIPELGQERSWIGGGDRPLVALPFNRSTPIAYLNGSIFEQHGQKPPATWRELRNTARALTVRRAERIERYGFGCPIDWWFWAALVGQAGGDVVEADGRVSLGGAAGVEALRFWQALVRDDRTMKPPPGRDYNAWEQTNQDFLAGRTAMIWTSTAFLKYLEQNARFPVVAAPLPGHRRRAVPTGGTHWVVLKSARVEEKQAAWAFLKYVHEPAQAIDWATQTGYLPVTRSAVGKLERDGYYAKHPNDRVAFDQLGVAMPWPWSVELFRIQREIVQPRLESAVLSGHDAQSLLDEARSLALRERGS
jgi:sn-glycerol 3-phosphate transport system substrate-binding protein